MLSLWEWKNDFIRVVLSLQLGLLGESHFPPSRPSSAHTPFYSFSHSCNDHIVSTYWVLDSASPQDASIPGN